MDLQTADEETSRKYGVAKGTRLIVHDFVLVTSVESENLRDANALAAMEKMGRRVKLLDHLPVPDVD